MKTILINIVISLFLITGILSCKERKQAEIITAAEEITTADTNTIVPGPDSLDESSLDPETHEKILQQDPPASPQPKKGGCNLTVSILPSPSEDHQFYQVKGFNPKDFSCWSELENQGLKLCGDKMPCEISFLDSGSSNPSDANQLKNHGIAHFNFKNSVWYLKGAKIWNRTGKEYEYQNTNNY